MFFFCILIIELQNVDRLHCQSLLCCALLRAVTFFSLQNRTTILDDRKYIFVGKRWTLLLNVFMILLLPILTFTFHLPCRRFFALFVLRRCQEEYYTRRQYHQSSTEQREHQGPWGQRLDFSFKNYDVLSDYLWMFECEYVMLTF